MRAVLDTTVFGYALLNGSGTDDALRILTIVTEPLAPDTVRAEFLSVVWKYVRTGSMTIENGKRLLDDANAVFGLLVPADALWHRALELSASTSHSTYDALFVALGEREDVPVVSFDVKMKRAFPGVVVSAQDFLEAV